MARLEGPSAPQVYLEETLRRLPRHIGLHRLLVEWLRGDPSECEAALRELLARHPADAWARRELALRLADQGRFEAALDAVARAAEVEPNAASTHGVRGHVLAQGGDTEDAKRAFQAAVARSADYSSAIGGWLDVTQGALKQEVLRFVAAELIRQRGAEGWFTLQRRARGVLDPGETRRLLERGRDQCPDVWEVHSALSDEIKDEGDLEGAAAALARATERFSLVASLWIDRASVAGLRGDGKAEIALLETAAAMAPGWTRPLRALAAAHRRQGGNQAAIPVLRRAVAQSPGEAELYGLLAEALQDVSGERSEIEPLLRRALAIDPAYSWAWERLAELAGPASAVGLARQIACVGDVRGGPAS